MRSIRDVFVIWGLGKGSVPGPYYYDHTRVVRGVSDMRGNGAGAGTSDLVNFKPFLDLSMGEREEEVLLLPLPLPLPAPILIPMPDNSRDSSPDGI